MTSNELNEPMSVSPGTVRKIWAGVTVTIGADVSANWQDLTMMLREGDRTDDGVLTDAACKRLAEKLSAMVQRRQLMLAEEIVHEQHLNGESCPDCLDTWPCLRLTRALRVLLNRA